MSYNVCVTAPKNELLKEAKAEFGALYPDADKVLKSRFQDAIKVAETVLDGDAFNHTDEVCIVVSGHVHEGENDPLQSSFSLTLYESHQSAQTRATEE